MFSYYEALNSPNFELLQGDSVTNVKGDQVFTKNGKQLRADVIVLCTGFRVRESEWRHRTVPSILVLVGGWLTRFATHNSALPAEGVQLRRRVSARSIARHQRLDLSRYRRRELPQFREPKSRSENLSGPLTFPFFKMWLMGPNTATGHSSVVFTSEAQLA